MSSALVHNLIRPELLALHAYHVPESSGMIKLDAMENPYHLPQFLKDEIAAIVANSEINRYPDPDPYALKEKIRQIEAVPEGCDVLLGNGSDELIQLLALALNRPGAALLSVEPSFVMYRMIATFVGMRYVGVPLKENFSLDIDAMREAIRRERPALVFLAYPNNPTGNLFSADHIRQIIAASPGLVVIDEAYCAFASDSFMKHIADYPNLLVMRTFSKLGMAGLRLGFLAGSSDWLDELEKLRLPYNVGVLPQRVAGVLLENHGMLLQQADQIKKDRAVLYGQLSSIAEVYPSEANFLLFRMENAATVFNELKARGMLIKNLDGAHAMLEDCLRVTVGTPLECQKFIEALQESII